GQTEHDRVLRGGGATRTGQALGGLRGSTKARMAAPKYCGLRIARMPAPSAAATAMTGLSLMKFIARSASPSGAAATAFGLRLRRQYLAEVHLLRLARSRPSSRPTPRPAKVAVSGRSFTRSTT